MTCYIHLFQNIVNCAWGGWDSENITGPELWLSWLVLVMLGQNPIPFCFCLFWLPLLLFLCPHLCDHLHHSSSSLHSLHSVQDLVVRCMQQMVCAKAANIRSGWKNIFSVFTLAAAHGEQAVVEMAFESTSKLMIFIVSACECGMIFLILYQSAQCCKCKHCYVCTSSDL